MQPFDKRGRLLAWGAIAAALAAGVALAVTALLASGAGRGAPVSSDKAQVRRQLASRLHARMLEPRWIACVSSGRRYHGAAVIRCNVNFGDPHVVAYCSVLRGDRLVTNFDEPSIPCGHDDAGWRAPVHTFN